MIWNTCTVSGSEVRTIFPIVKNPFTYFRYVCVVFNPDTFFLSCFDQIVARNFDRHNRGITQLNSRCGPCTSAPRPAIVHVDTARESPLITVVNVNDCFIAAVCFVLSYPGINKISYSLSGISHSINPLVTVFRDKAVHDFLTCYVVADLVIIGLVRRVGAKCRVDCFRGIRLLCLRQDTGKRSTSALVDNVNTFHHSVVA